MIGIVLATVFYVGVEAVHDRTQYHFENPSSWDTPFLVPHFFEQKYSGGKAMVVFRARSPRFEFEAGATPARSASGSDYDTFLQPSGDVIFHGYADVVRMRSWRAASYAHSGIWHAGVAYSRDQSKFPPTMTTTTHTSPPSVATSFTDTRETTASDVLEARVGFERTASVVTWGVDVAPVTVARLTTNLPDKYASPIRFSARAFTASSHIAAEWQLRRISVIVGAQLAQSWRYARRSSFTSQRSGVSFALGFR